MQRRTRVSSSPDHNIRIIFFFSLPFIPLSEMSIALHYYRTVSSLGMPSYSLAMTETMIQIREQWGQAVPSSLQIAEMFSTVEALAYNCNTAEASMYLRKTRKAFIAARETSKNADFKQAVLTTSSQRNELCVVPIHTTRIKGLQRFFQMPPRWICTWGTAGASSANFFLRPTWPHSHLGHTTHRRRPAGRCSAMCLSGRNQGPTVQQQHQQQQQPTRVSDAAQLYGVSDSPFPFKWVCGPQ